MYIDPVEQLNEKLEQSFVNYSELQKVNHTLNKKIKDLENKIFLLKGDLVKQDEATLANSNDIFRIEISRLKDLIGQKNKLYLEVKGKFNDAYQTLDFIRNNLTSICNSDSLVGEPKEHLQASLLKLNTKLEAL